MDDGDYQRCGFCDKYIECVWWDIEYHDCGPGEVWDDNRKQCAGKSETCPEAAGE